MLASCYLQVGPEKQAIETLVIEYPDRKARKDFQNWLKNSKMRFKVVSIAGKSMQVHFMQSLSQDDLKRINERWSQHYLIEEKNAVLMLSCCVQP